MSNFETVENSLRNVYFNIIQEAIDNVHPLLSKIEKTYMDVWGKEIIKPIYEDPYDDHPILLRNELKDLRFSFPIPIEWLDNSFLSVGSYINSMITEINRFVEKIKIDLSNQLYLDNSTVKYPQFYLTGLGSIFSDSETLYGLERSNHQILNPYITEVHLPINMMKFIDNTVNDIYYSRKSRTNLIIFPENFCGFMDRSEYIERYSKVDIEIIFDSYCPEDRVYLLNTNDFKIHQLNKWHWEENGSRRILSVRNRFDKIILYEAVLSKNFDLICSKPYCQGMIKIIKEK